LRQPAQRGCHALRGFGKGSADMKHILSIAVVGAVLFLYAPAVDAKGSPDKIIVTRGGLVRPVEITERETLQGFDPWMGRFIDWSKGPVGSPIAGSSDQAQIYEVFFYMKWKGRHSRFDRGNLKLIYSFRYCPGRVGEAGLIYLPGKDDKYHVNSGTIWREGDDGKWHQASAAWDALMKRALT